MPDLGTSIIWRSSLGLKDSSLGNLGHIEVTKLDHSVLGQKYVRTFDITMNDLLFVETLEPQHHLIEDGPDIILFGKLLSLLGVINLALEITVVAILHDNAERVSILLEERLLVTGDVWVSDRS